MSTAERADVDVVENMSRPTWKENRTAEVLPSSGFPKVEVVTWPENITLCGSEFCAFQYAYARTGLFLVYDNIDDR
jgi:hypothetical protein